MVQLLVMLWFESALPLDSQLFEMGREVGGGFMFGLQVIEILVLN